MTGEAGSAIARGMTDDPPFSPALLPAGFVDLLTPDARTEARGVATLMDVFASHGYDSVRPPLMEFEETYLAGAGVALAEQCFRVMDPDTRRMMVLRPDITPQIARMAATRVGGLPRPLRVSYAGPCVVVAPVAAEESSRQIMQTGIELIGPDSPEADAEVMSIGAEALMRLGVKDVSFDLTMPPFIPALLEEAGVPVAHRPALMRALDRKDAAAVAQHGGALAATLIALLDATGAAEHTVAHLAELTLPPKARVILDRLIDTVAALREICPTLRMTVDPVEFRGWKYHTGVCVTLFAVGRSEELGRGGRYLCNDNEPACGLTLRPDILFRMIPPAPARERVYLAVDASRQQAASLRAQGYATVQGFASGAQAETEARHLGCASLLTSTQRIDLTQG
ncbi:ATP phosphoribosyltransferase regulatory subunit [Acetobacter syzygii]|uniref:ATP phosphoribosyltransferase regulatory subunit n=1 Tax=Acetobacter syzygii TaxID=146476 RepID=UPI0005DEFB6D|nr:ATP phosphoribosyltransferase regulatory subunit [Acetobacter syzygii]NSL93852.1 ATP phosphoribosyltransferase regulatory subunit [Acetobacter syzygii]GAN71455.1 histidyl-tRNA synthetase [Acetobacter syzygii]GEL56399.1 ATP phosphoribosyltransferase regulatory subunit [Acetobacter syzygii]